MNKSALLEHVKKHAEEHKEVLNSNSERLDFVLKGLLANEKKFGEIYCPCRLVTGNKEKDKEIICPCVFHTKEVKDQGHCLCQLFFRR